MKKLSNYLYLFIAIFLFVSCDEDDSMNHGLTAVAGPDQEASVGIAVTLDASSSIDLHGDGFNTTWSFASTPNGSTASISNANSLTASFIPDLPGDYQINLTISNDLGQSSDDMIVTAIESGTVEIGGTYNDDLHLINIVSDPDVPDYIVTNSINIYAGLIIDPGVRIAVMSDNSIRVRGSGVIKANGTATEPIYISGTSDLPGFWRGMTVETNSLENEINYMHFSGSGSNNILTGRSRTALHVEGRVNINHSSFRNNDGFGLTVSVNESRIPLNNNTFENNSLGAVLMTAGQIRDIDNLSNFNSGDIVISSSVLNLGVEHVWGAAQNGQYRFSGSINIYDNVTIEEGAAFISDNDVLIRFRSGSIVKALGSSNNPITFKGSLEQAGSWRGLTVEDSNLENILQHVHFAHAGHSNILTGFSKAALGVGSGARLTLNNVNFSDIDGYGVYIRHSDVRVQFENSQFGDGITQAAVHLLSSHIADIDSQTNFGGNYVEVDGNIVLETDDVTWPKLNNGMYLFTNTTNIYGRVAIAAGAIFEFDNDALIRVRSNAVFIADGTSNDMIIFRNKTGSAAHWKGIAIETSSLENSMDYVVVSHGGNSNLVTGIGQTNIGVSSGARLSLTNSTISNSLGYGVYVRGTLEESGNTFSDNALDDIYHQ